MGAPLIETVHLKKYFKVNHSLLHAVDDVSLSINEGETLGVVGESGCGKSTLGRTILNLETATDGEVRVSGENLLACKGKRKKEILRSMQMIFQDPYSSLNPRMTVERLIAEPMLVCEKNKTKKQIMQRVEELMDLVGLAKRLANAYPHELDGGRRQRIGVARALALNPRFIVCDEPVSALDVSIQAQILNLLVDLQKELGLTYMFITHDISVVKYISNNIAVMYLGQCVELAPKKELFKNRLHPYTEALLDAVLEPTIEMRKKRPQLVKGELTSPIDPKPGCRFYARCRYASEECVRADIPLEEVRPGHFVACKKFKRIDR